MVPKSVRQIWDASKVAITFDGNSMVDPVYSNLCTQLQALRPLNGNFTISNFALSGQTIANMDSAASDVDSAFVIGKTNFLLIWEVTNSIFVDGITGVAACTQLATYIANRKAVHPWRVVVLTCIPRGANLYSYTAASGEVQLQAANDYLRKNYKSMGIEALVEMRRTGGPFDFTDSSNSANFPVGLWTDYTHPNSAGHAYTARYIADVLVNLRAK